MDEKRAEQIKQEVEEVLEAKKVLKKYSSYNRKDEWRIGAFLTDTYVANNLFELAEVLGADIIKTGDYDVEEDGSIEVKYEFYYEGFRFYGYEKIGNIEEVIG